MDSTKALKFFAGEINRIEKNYAEFGVELHDDTPYAAGNITIGHLRTLRALSEQGESAQPAADGWRRGDYVVYDNGFGPVTARVLGYVEGWINLGFSDGSSEICRPSRISRLASQAMEETK